MRAFLLFFLSITTFFSALSDPDPDSLRKIWMKPDIPDTLRLKALDQRALDYIYTKPDSDLCIEEKNVPIR
jgi:hypothetical protein